MIREKLVNFWKGGFKNFLTKFAKFTGFGAIGIILLGFGLMTFNRLVNKIPISEQIKSLLAGDFPSMYAAGFFIEQANETKPYTVFVKRYREEEDAQNAITRLRKKKHPAYIIPKMQENNEIWYDVQVGAYPSIDSASNALLSLYQDALKNSSITTYQDYISNYIAFTNSPSSVRTTYIPPRDIPTMHTDIVETLYRFPVNSDYSIVWFCSAIPNYYYKYSGDDFSDGYRIKYWLVPSVKPLRELFWNSDALAQASYYDKLFEHTIHTTVFKVKNDYSISTALSSPPGETVVSNIQYKTQMGIIYGNIYSESTNQNRYTFVGHYNTSNYVVVYRSFNAQLDHLTEFINKDTRKEGILFYPEVYRNFSFLKKESSAENNMLFFITLNRLGWEYAKERDNAWWARSMVGHWNLSARYEINRSMIDIGLFNLLYPSKAKRVHQNFQSEKEKEALFRVMMGGQSYPVSFPNAAGWYLDFIDLNELSVSYGSVIVAVNSFQAFRLLPSNELKNIMFDLRIWPKIEQTSSVETNLAI
jgi:hypothetical protein